MAMKPDTKSSIPILNPNPNLNPTTQIVMDTAVNSQLRINFNVTMLDMSCDYASVDLYVHT